MTTKALAHIAELWRYPVKSMAGESVQSLDLLPDGIAHDRRFAIESSGAPVGKPLLTGRERAAMLLQRATVAADRTTVTLTDGRQFPVDDPALLPALASILPQAAVLPQATVLPQTNDLALVRGAAPLTDCRPIALHSREALAQLSSELNRPVDARRFRANIVLAFTSPADEVAPENALVGHTLQLGPTARLRVTERDPRCRIVTLDPDTAEPDPSLMKHLDRHHDGCFGIYAVTVTPGLLSVGDPVTDVA